MFIIAHRGNLNGPSPSTENTPEQILFALSQGFHCEIDVWIIDNNIYLGHDGPQYIIPLIFLLENASKLWCHCKNLNAFEKLLTIKIINCFYHHTDPYVLTSHGYIWTYPQKLDPEEKGITVMPEWDETIKHDPTKISGICTDYPYEINRFLIL